MLARRFEMFARKPCFWFVSTVTLGVGSCDDCEDVGCGSTVQVTLPDFSEDENTGLVLVTCNQGVCAELAWNPTCTYQETERFTAGWCLSAEAQTWLSIEPKFVLTDGDEYSISIRAPGGEALLEVVFVANYSTTTPSDACESCTTAKGDFTE